MFCYDTLRFVKLRLVTLSYVELGILGFVVLRLATLSYVEACSDMLC